MSALMGGKSEHHMAGYFLTESPGDRKPAPQKQTASVLRK